VAIPLRKVIASTSKIRVLVVDDSVVIRRLVTQALAEDPGVEVVGVAANGAIALQRIPQANPDVVTLDIEMPEMDGLETLRRIRQQYKDLRIIMFSTLTQRGATATIDALMLGADDYVTKAANVGKVSESLAALRGELIPRINQFFLRKDAGAGSSTIPTPVPAPAAVRTTPRIVPAFRPQLTPQVVAIGVSTGGPTALSAIVPRFPETFALPILIVQHMPPLFTKLLADRLQKQTALRVVEGQDGLPVRAGTVYVAPGDYHMRVRRHEDQVVLSLDQAPPENSCRPAVDVMFRSVHEVYGGRALSVVLTGMGQDGLRGVELLRAAGARVIVQDEVSSVVWGMPGAVVRANLADAIVSLDDIVPEILRHV
jgi:two-component system, chemotaxis family, protein-glutamate methylesterase/glutaminase